MVSVVTDSAGSVISEVENHGGSNQLAEFIAIEHAIEEALKSKWKKVLIITDSRTAIIWADRDDAEKLKPKKLAKMNDPEWYQAVKGRVDDLRRFIDVTFEWCPRSESLAGHYIEERYGL
jgi:ribonuclease HI